MTTLKSTTTWRHNHMTYDKETIDKVWRKGEEIPGKNPNLYREDVCGNEMYKPAYGKTGEKSWEIDHKKPSSKGGSDSLRNLQPLQTAQNRKKGNTYPRKPKR